MYGFYYDPTYVMVLIGVVICMLASANVNRTFQKYSRIRSHSGMTGREAAERLLHANGIYDVTVQRAAALTYVASAASAILQLLRLILISGGRRRND